VVRGATATLLANNLVYGNAGDGIAVGTDNLASPSTRIVNNTLSRNAGWGLRIGGGEVASADALVLNNIVASNGRGGIAVARSSACGYVAGFNLTTDPYGDATPRNDYDLRADPLFLDPTKGDFRLRPESPAIDAGSGDVGELGIGGSTAEDGAPDRGVVDLGFHYDNSSVPIRASVPFLPLFVRVSGSAANDGLSPAKALASITAAGLRAAAGTTIVVGPGVYLEGDIRVRPNTGRITFAADPSGVLTGDVPGPVLVDARRKADTGFVLLGSCRVSVRNFHVTGARTAGIQVRAGSDGAHIAHNVVFSNERRGIDVIGADDVTVFDNLVYANGTGGVSVGGSTGSRRATIRSNTAYGNGANGIQIGTGGGASSEARVEYNLVAENGGRGVQLDSNTRAGISGEGYVARYNCNSDGYGAGTPRPASDLSADPLLVDPDGDDGILGGAGFRDDNFRLRQLAAGQPEQSPCVDFAPVNARSLGLDDRTTRSDGVPDRGTLDLGYHYVGVPAVTWYVSPAGSDEDIGSSPARPLRTIREALSRAVTGDVVRILEGTHTASGLRPPPGVTISGTSTTVIDAAGGSTVFDVRAPDVTIEDLGITGATSAGIRVRADRFELIGARVFSNPGKGVFLQSGRDALLFNNLVYDNGNSGIVVGDRTAGTIGAAIVNNTVWRNANFGVTVGLSTSVPSVDTVVALNVFADNARQGVAVGQDSAPSLRASHNCNNTGYRGIEPLPSDFTGDPLLLVHPGSHGPVFRLEHAAAGQKSTSRCVNFGRVRAGKLGLGQSTTRTDGVPDAGLVDAGYHEGTRAADTWAVRSRVRKQARLAAPEGAGDR